MLRRFGRMPVYALIFSFGSKRLQLFDAMRALVSGTSTAVISACDGS